MKSNEFNGCNLSELTNSEILYINGGADDSLAHDIRETVGYFFGYLYTAGPGLIKDAVEILAVIK